MGQKSLPRPMAADSLHPQISVRLGPPESLSAIGVRWHPPVTAQNLSRPWLAVLSIRQMTPELHGVRTSRSDRGLGSHPQAMAASSLPSPIQGRFSHLRILEIPGWHMGASGHGVRWRPPGMAPNWSQQFGMVRFIPQLIPVQRGSRARVPALGSQLRLRLMGQDLLQWFMQIQEIYTPLRIQE